MLFPLPLPTLFLEKSLIKRSIIFPLISHLVFGDNFNRHVDSLPSSLTHINFGDSFNRKVDSLPDSLTYLSFTCISVLRPSFFLTPSSFTEIFKSYGSYYVRDAQFNKPIDSLPPSLTHLLLGNKFNHCWIVTSFSHSFNIRW
jgi:hypothetical protein